MTFPLPYEIQRLVIQKMQTPALYDLISGKTPMKSLAELLCIEVSQDNHQELVQLLQSHYQFACRVFLSRRGTQASGYQASALKTWLYHKHFPLDKKSMFNLMVEALQDPLSSDEHKMLACAVIQTLFPHPEVEIPKTVGYRRPKELTQETMQDPYELMLLVSSLSNSHKVPDSTIEKILSALFNHLASTKGMDAIIYMFMRYLIPFLVKPESRDKVFEALLLVIHFDRGEPAGQAAKSLGTLAPFLSQASDKLILINGLLAMLEKDNSCWTIPRAIAEPLSAALLALNSEEKTNEVLKKIIYYLSDECQGLPYEKTDYLYLLVNLAPALQTETQLKLVLQTRPQMKFFPTDLILLLPAHLSHDKLKRELLDSLLEYYTETQLSKLIIYHAEGYPVLSHLFSASLLSEIRAGVLSELMSLKLPSKEILVPLIPSLIAEGHGTLLFDALLNHVVTNECCPCVFFQLAPYFDETQLETLCNTPDPFIPRTWVHAKRLQFRNEFEASIKEFENILEKRSSTAPLLFGYQAPEFAVSATSLSSISGVAISRRNSF